ncbi:hypothetical protein D3C79_48410 [compost metagenome]
MAEQAPPPAPAPVILEENLTGLPFLRNLVTGLFFEWSKDQGDPSVVSFMDSLRQIFLEPLISFDKAYDVFCKHCTEGAGSNKVGDHWRAFQMVVWTELNTEVDSTMIAFCDMTSQIMAGSPGGENLIPAKLRKSENWVSNSNAKTSKTPFDYALLLAIRVYGASIRPESQPAQQ